MSAQTGRQVPDLLAAIKPHLPEGPALYGEDDLTDRSERFLAAELLREKLFRLLGEEVPYAIAVEIEQFETAGNLRRIGASILVDRPGQKAIVIGKRRRAAQGDRHTGAARYGEVVRRQSVSGGVGAGEARLGGGSRYAAPAGIRMSARRE